MADCHLSYLVKLYFKGIKQTRQNVSGVSEVTIVLTATLDLTCPPHIHNDKNPNRDNQPLLTTATSDWTEDESASAVDS